MQEYYKSCSQLIWPFYDLSQLYDLKCQKTHIFAIWVHKCHKSLFLAYLTVFYNCMTWNVRKLISLRSQCTSIANRFLSLIDCFTVSYSCMSKNLRKLVSLRSQCRSITNQFSYLIWPFYGLLQLYDLKCQKTHNCTISVHKYHKLFS